MHGYQRIEETPRGIDRMINVCMGKIIVPLSAMIRPGLTKHPLSHDIALQCMSEQYKQYNMHTTGYFSRPYASWPFVAASCVEVARLVQQS